MSTSDRAAPPPTKSLTIDFNALAGGYVAGAAVGALFGAVCGTPRTQAALLFGGLGAVCGTLGAAAGGAVTYTDDLTPTTAE